MGLERASNKSQHTKSTPRKKILPPLLPEFELATFRSSPALYQQAPTGTILAFPVACRFLYACLVDQFTLYLGGGLSPITARGSGSRLAGVSLRVTGLACRVFRWTNTPCYTLKEQG